MESKSGDLRVRKDEDMLWLDFPSGFCEKVNIPPKLNESFSAKPVETLAARDYLMAVYESEEIIKNMKPDFNRLKELPYHAITYLVGEIVV